MVTLLSIAICVGATVALVRGEFSTLAAEVLAGVVLVSFGFAVYGMLRIALALIETAGERRRREREVSERRKAAREESQ